MSDEGDLAGIIVEVFYKILTNPFTLISLATFPTVGAKIFR